MGPVSCKERTKGTLFSPPPSWAAGRCPALLNHVLASAKPPCGAETISCPKVKSLEIMPPRQPRRTASPSQGSRTMPPTPKEQTRRSLGAKPSKVRPTYSGHPAPLPPP